MPDPVHSAIVSLATALTPVSRRRRNALIGAGIHGIMIMGMSAVIAAGSHALDLASAFAAVGLSMLLARFARRRPAIGDHVLDLWLMALLMLAKVMSTVQSPDPTAQHVHGVLRSSIVWIVIPTVAWIVARPVSVRIRGGAFTFGWWTSAATTATSALVMLVFCR
jgi:hypothetical protein